MRIVSVNLGSLRPLFHEGKVHQTGIFKQPVAGRVKARSLGLEGDQQGNPHVHGGINKAVYAYPLEHYARWKHELGRDDLTFGQFGENLTVEGINEDTAHIGDTFRIGTALLEVSEPRFPCFKLNAKMENPGFGVMIIESERTGFYLRVLEEGEIGAGDAIERVSLDPEQISVRNVHHWRFVAADDLDSMRRASKLSALPQGWRRALAEKLS